MFKVDYRRDNTKEYQPVGGQVAPILFHSLEIKKERYGPDGKTNQFNFRVDKAI